jgi:hypothetical protein
MTNTNTQQTNWYQNLIENIQDQSWYQNTITLAATLGLAGMIYGPVLILEHLNPTPNYQQQNLIVLNQALHIEQHHNPSNAQAIANQFGGMSNLEQAVSNYVHIANLNVDHASVLNLNQGNVHLDSIVCATNNGEALVNLNYHTHSQQTIPGTKGLISEPGTINHTMGISPNSINLALQEAPSNNVKGGE